MEPYGHRPMTGRRADYAARFLVRAAITAPSVCNTQPWRFVSRRGALELRAAPSRALWASDPDGREMVISCGAALFNLRVAMRHLGFVPLVRLLPDRLQPDLLAEIRWGEYEPPTPDTEVLHRAMSRRHAHHGPFTAAPLRPALVTELHDIVRRERAGLLVIRDRAELRLLADLTAAAELTQRTDPRFVAERTRWTSSPDAPRPDGMTARDRPAHRDGMDFFTGAHANVHAVPRATPPQAPRTPRPDPRTLGTAVLLTTWKDRRLDWLLAGQALQHLLLHASARQVAAAFHTQALELPGPRAEISTELAGGTSPQMILRLGHPTHKTTTGRRHHVTDVLTETG